GRHRSTGRTSICVALSRFLSLCNTRPNRVNNSGRKGSPTTVLHSVRRSLIPCWVGVALNRQPAYIALPEGPSFPASLAAVKKRPRDRSDGDRPRWDSYGESLRGFSGYLQDATLFQLGHFRAALGGFKRFERRA